MIFKQLIDRHIQSFVGTTAEQVDEMFDFKTLESDEPQWLHPTIILLKTEILS